MTAAAALRSWPGRAAAVAVLAVGAGSLTLIGGSPAYAAGLVPWEDCDALLDHYRDELTRVAQPYGGGELVSDTAAGVALPAAPLSAVAEARTSTSVGPAVGTGPTGTNVQEAGVDEPDVAKLTGDLLVTTAGDRLQVVRAGAQPELVGSVELGPGVGGGELLVDGDRVLVLGSAFTGGPVPLPEPMPVEPEPVPVEPQPVEPQPVEPQPLPVEPAPDEPLVPVEPAEPPVEPDAPAVDVPAVERDAEQSGGGSDAVGVAVAPPTAGMSSFPVPGVGVVRVVLVDVAEPAAPRVVEQLEVDGRYVTARLVDGTVRLVTASSPQLPAVQPEEPYGPAEQRAALEEAVAGAGIERVLPQARRLDAAGEELSSAPAVECADVQRAQDEPSGATTLLVTTLRPGGGLEPLDTTAVTTDGDLVYASADRLYVATSRWGTVGPIAGREGGEATTELHAFDTTAPDATDYVGSGSVPGFLYGRWALSEYEGVLRVATTLEPPWEGGEQVSSSLITLAEEGDRLVEIGRLDGLGPSERIFAVRYFGDVATVVTFRQTDPLYVLDLADPRQPRLLGELKIPGFSTYLHPIGDGRLLGVGQDATDQGQVTGFQISLFDLSDPANPTQLDRLSLGEGYSPASDDSRAFSYDPQRRLAVLPFTTWNPRTGLDTPSALAVRVDGDTLVEAGRLEVGRGLGIGRVVLGGDLAYALTYGGVVAAELPSMARTGEAAFAGVEPVPQEAPAEVPPDEADCTVSSDGAVTCEGSAGSGSAGSSEPAAPGTG